MENRERYVRCKCNAGQGSTDVNCPICHGCGFILEPILDRYRCYHRAIAGCDYFRYLDTGEKCCKECFIRHVNIDKDQTRLYVGAPHGSSCTTLYLKYFSEVFDEDHADQSYFLHLP